LSCSIVKGLNFTLCQRLDARISTAKISFKIDKKSLLGEESIGKSNLCVKTKAIPRYGLAERSQANEAGVAFLKKIRDVGQEERRFIMKVSKAVNYCIDYHKQNSKKKYGSVIW